jgi:hypothetical protein
MTMPTTNISTQYLQQRRILERQPLTAANLKLQNEGLIRRQKMFMSKDRFIGSLSCLGTGSVFLRHELFMS